jgi:hypothetical protein
LLTHDTILDTKNKPIIEKTSTFLNKLLVNLISPDNIIIDIGI